MNRLAVIILNYNSSDDCKKCIAQLKAQLGIELELIIVDNASCEEERQKIEHLCSSEDIKLICINENRGYAAGNNIGLRKAAQLGYKIAAICNPDMEFPQLDCLKKCLERVQEDPTIAILGPDIIMPDGLTHQNPQMDGDDNFFETFMGPYYLLKGFIQGNLPKSYAEPDWMTSRYCKKVIGCFFLIRISFLERIGYLDEGTFLYCEEPILARQVRRENMRECYLAEAHVVHHHVKSQKGNPCRNMKIFQKSQLYLYKHYCNFTKWQYFWIWLSRFTGNSIWNLAIGLKHHLQKSK